MSVLPNVAPHEYNGTVNMTKSGLPCQFWVDDIPHPHSYHNPDYYPDDTLEEAQNYCRDPDKAGYIWCYTTNPMVRFEECALQGLLFDFP
jgi:hypothetical protein